MDDLREQLMEIQRAMRSDAEKYSDRGDLYTALKHYSDWLERALAAQPAPGGVSTGPYVERLIRIFRDHPHDDTSALVLRAYGDARAAAAAAAAVAAVPTHRDLTDDEADRIAGLVECDVGMGAGAWDTVPALDIIRAAHKVMRPNAGVPEGWLQDVADAAASLDKRGDRKMAARMMRLHSTMLAAAPQPEANPPESPDSSFSGAGVRALFSALHQSLAALCKIPEDDRERIPRSRVMDEVVAIRRAMDQMSQPKPSEPNSSEPPKGSFSRTGAGAVSGEAVAVPVGEVQHPCNAPATAWLYEPRNLKHGTKLYAGAPPADAEALIRECVPGGDICDPQQVADNIREYFGRLSGGEG
jgi:hypothetical protein